VRALSPGARPSWPGSLRAHVPLALHMCVVPFTMRALRLCTAKLEVQAVMWMCAAEEPREGVTTRHSPSAPDAREPGSVAAPDGDAALFARLAALERQEELEGDEAEGSGYAERVDIDLEAAEGVERGEEEGEEEGGGGEAGASGQRAGQSLPAGASAGAGPALAARGRAAPAEGVAHSPCAAAAAGPPFAGGHGGAPHAAAAHTDRPAPAAASAQAANATQQPAATPKGMRRGFLDAPGASAGRAGAARRSAPAEATTTHGEGSPEATGPLPGAQPGAVVERPPAGARAGGAEPADGAPPRGILKRATSGGASARAEPEPAARPVSRFKQRRQAGAAG